jgi:hypothetical protein
VGQEGELKISQDRPQEGQVLLAQSYPLTSVKCKKLPSATEQPGVKTPQDTGMVFTVTDSKGEKKELLLSSANYSALKSGHADVNRVVTKSSGVGAGEKNTGFSSK